MHICYRPHSIFWVIVLNPIHSSSIFLFLCYMCSVTTVHCGMKTGQHTLHLWGFDKDWRNPLSKKEGSVTDAINTGLDWTLTQCFIFTCTVGTWEGKCWEDYSRRLRLVIHSCSRWCTVVACAHISLYLVWGHRNDRLGYFCEIKAQL